MNPTTKPKVESIILAEVLAELHRARSKNAKFNSPHEGYAVLLEEVDELWAEVKANNHNRQYFEAIQVAAMSLRFLYDLCGDIASERVLREVISNDGHDF